MTSNAITSVQIMSRYGSARKSKHSYWESYNFIDNITITADNISSDSEININSSDSDSDRNRNTDKTKQMRSYLCSFKVRYLVHFKMYSCMKLKLYFNKGFVIPLL